MKKNALQIEIDASYLYGVLADLEKDPAMVAIFKQMSEIELSHAHGFAEKMGIPITQLPSPSKRAQVLRQIGKWLGNDYILGVLLDTEKSLSNSILSQRNKQKSSPSISDTAHVSILKNMLNNPQNISASNLARFEKRHRSIGGNALRAAVLGGNDGLVSNFSLVMGVAGATNGNKEVLLAGVAGLLAGALSMALGEWISVKSSQELYQNQLDLEKEELETNPAGEEKELALIYMSKGIEAEQAKEMAAKVMLDADSAHQILVKEELGINADDMEGSAMEAAVSSFVLFSIGAIIPVFPFFFSNGMIAIFLSAGLSAVGLFGIGSAITLFTGKSIWFSGFRQVVFGLTAAAITFGIGKLIGISIAG